jgi:hypothetical protein
MELCAALTKRLSADCQLLMAKGLASYCVLGQGVVAVLPSCASLLLLPPDILMLPDWVPTNTNMC